MGRLYVKPILDRKNDPRLKQSLYRIKFNLENELLLVSNSIPEPEIVLSGYFNSPVG